MQDKKTGKQLALIWPLFLFFTSIKLKGGGLEKSFKCLDKAMGTRRDELGTYENLKKELLKAGRR